MIDLVVKLVLRLNSYVNFGRNLSNWISYTIIISYK